MHFGSTGTITLISKLSAILAWRTAVQLPVNYKERIGDSSVTGSLRKAFYLGIQMILLIIAMRFKADKLLLKVIK